SRAVQTSAAVAEAKDLSAGTEFTVSVNDDCSNPGKISSNVFSQNAAASHLAASKAPARMGIAAYTWRLPVAMTIEELNELADADQCVHGISESTVATLQASDPLRANQAHVKMLGLDLIALPKNMSRRVVIAIVDSGIDLQHEDLRNVLWKNSKEIAGNDLDDDQNGYVDDVYGYNFASRIGSPAHQGTWLGNFHGTHVAGLAAAQSGNGRGVTGAALSNASIMALNVFGPTSGAYSANIANAIRYAADNGADVINLSLGGQGRNAAYESAVAYALAKGATVLAAAGNDARPVSESYFMAPAAYARGLAGMISVGSIDSSTSKLSTFSNHGSNYVELAAPGSENSVSGFGLLSTIPGNKYDRLEGTSMASPVAAGSAALAITLLRSRGFEPSPATIEALMEVSSKRISALQEKIRDGRVLNLKNLADFVENAYPEKGHGEDPGVPGFDPCAVGGN
ncbi:MAG: S8 family serine peptidase, partial [Bdellovibrionota bacterium]